MVESSVTTVRALVGEWRRWWNCPDEAVRGRVRRLTRALVPLVLALAGLVVAVVVLVVVVVAVVVVGVVGAVAGPFG
ncbi:hypothetical protein [Streptacidiphilus sp. EB103A]|uniref:hypothetical protein n=1 Tax=Streptacidiphilus sp. EB103A TaxID=3156275 RepID=UPI003512182E